MKSVTKKDLAATTLDLEDEMFQVYITSLSISKGVYLLHRAQIAPLKIHKVSITVFLEYSNFVIFFSLELAAGLPKHTEISNYAISLIKSKQPSYGPISSLELIVLDILKIYIDINLANSFIKLLQSARATPILFI